MFDMGTYLSMKLNFVDKWVAKFNLATSAQCAAGELICHFAIIGRRLVDIVYFLLPPRP
jgi:hypothetical protein